MTIKRITKEKTSNKGKPATQNLNVKHPQALLIESWSYSFNGNSRSLSSTAIWDSSQNPARVKEHPVIQARAENSKQMAAKSPPLSATT